MRGRSIANVSAASAAALAAGLVLTPVVDLPFPALVVGSAATLGLIVSTAAFLVASVGYATESRRGAFLRVIRPWVEHVAPKADATARTYDELNNHALLLQKRIGRAIDFGMIFGGLSAAALLLSIALSLFLPRDSLITVLVPAEALDGTSCVVSGSSAWGTVRMSELREPGEYLRFTPFSSECNGLDSTIDVLIAKPDIIELRL